MKGMNVYLKSYDVSFLSQKLHPGHNLHLDVLCRRNKMERNTWKKMEMIYIFPKYDMYGVRGMKGNDAQITHTMVAFPNPNRLRVGDSSVEELIEKDICMYTIYFHPDSLSVFQWKMTETAENVSRNVLLFTLKDLFKSVVGDLIFLTSTHTWIEVEPFINREYNSFFPNYWKKNLCHSRISAYHFLWTVVIYGTFLSGSAFWQGSTTYVSTSTSESWLCRYLTGDTNTDFLRNLWHWLC